MTPTQPKVYNYALLVVSICIAFAIVEIFCRLVLPRPGLTPLNGNWLPGAITSHPTRLYQLMPNSSALLTGGSFGEMEIKTNSIGLRERPLDELRQSEFRILAVGDSLTFGTGIKREQAWPAQVERALHKELLSPSSSITVINAGVPGYSLAQIRDLTEELLTELSPQIVILGVFAGGIDRLANPYVAFENLVIRKSESQRVQVVEGGLVHSDMWRPSTAAFDLWLERHSYVGALLFHGMHALYERAQALLRSDNSPDSPTSDHQAPPSGLIQDGLEEIRQIHKATSNRGIKLIVMPIASFDTANRVYRDEELTNAAIKEWCSAERILTFDPTTVLGQSNEALRLNPNDYHWSASANAIVGQGLASYLILQHTIRRSY